MISAAFQRKLVRCRRRDSVNKRQEHGGREPQGPRPIHPIRRGHHEVRNFRCEFLRSHDKVDFACSVNFPKSS